MTTYAALLRGVNVGGNLLKMDRLRLICAELGLENVRTYVQSGNIVFAAARGNASHWAGVLESRLSGESRLPVAVLVRTGAQIERIVAGNPFLKEKGIDPARLHVTFLRQAPAKSAIGKLDALAAGADRFRCAGTEIYLHCPDGYVRSKLSNNALEKALAIPATTRNWNTVRTLHEMLAG